MTDQADKPNPSDFSVDEKPGEYSARFEARGEIEVTIRASSEAEAREMAEAMIDGGEIELAADDMDEVRVIAVRRARPMYRVLCDGRKMQKSNLEPGDMPREPDERGF